MDAISSIRPAAHGLPGEPNRAGVPHAPRSQEAAPRAEAPLHEAPARAAAAVEPVELGAATERLNDFLRHSSRVRFQVGEGNLTVQVVDTATDEVIRSIPAEKVIELRDHFRELTGILLDDRV
jgi:uncharacterized FlaG/YvyC family protein